MKLKLNFADGVVVLFLSVMLSSPLSLYAQRLIWLGTPGTEAYGVSHDGSVVVGAAYPGPLAFRWQNGLMQILGTLGGDASWALGVSADGSVVVGKSYNSNGFLRAFRWTVSGGMQDLGTLGGNNSAAYSVSADGSVVVGWAENANGTIRAFRWTATDGMHDLGSLLENWESEAYAVSDDGSVVVGRAVSSDYYFHPFRWTLNSGMQDLGIPPGFLSGEALGVSPDGKVVVGFLYPSLSDPYAFRWSVSNRMQSLGRATSELYDASADGTVLVGWSGGLAVRWTISNGWEVLDSVYSNLLSFGEFFSSARAISPDGRYIVGAGLHRVGVGQGEAYLLDTQSPPTFIEQKFNTETLNYQLHQNYPNPFNPTTTIRFSLPQRSHVTLKVFDLLGREVATLVNGELNAGEHEVVFNAKDLPGGVYFYRLQADKFNAVKKMILLK